MTDKASARRPVVPLLLHLAALIGAPINPPPSTPKEEAIQAMTWGSCSPCLAIILAMLHWAQACKDAEAEGAAKPDSPSNSNGLCPKCKELFSAYLHAD